MLLKQFCLCCILGFFVVSFGYADVPIVVTAEFRTQVCKVQTSEGQSTIDIKFEPIMASEIQLFPTAIADATKPINLRLVGCDSSTTKVKLTSKANGTYPFGGLGFNGLKTSKANLGIAFTLMSGGSVHLLSVDGDDSYNVTVGRDDFTINATLYKISDSQPKLTKGPFTASLSIVVAYA